MQTTIVFLVFFCLRNISLAADVVVYGKYYYDYSLPGILGPDAESQFPWKFSYLRRNERGDEFFMYIFIRNKSPSITAIQVTYQLDGKTFEVGKSKYEYGRRKGEDYYYVHVDNFIKFNEIKIKLNVYTSKTLCSSLLVAEGRNFSNIANESLQKQFPLYDIFTKDGYILVVDLKKICNGPQTPLATDTNMSTTTDNADTDIQTIKPNNTFKPDSSKNLETTTNKNSTIDTTTEIAMDTTTRNTAVTDGETIHPNNTFTSNSSTNLEITTHENSTIDTTTETTMDTTTRNTAVTDGETIHPNNTFTSNSSTNLEITTHENSTIDTKNAESSQNIVLYVILSVIGMCVMILVIYLIRVKKYCHRNSNPVQTIELNTYSPANEVVYADLSLVHGDNQPPRREEESPYAQIIGVLNPADGNVKNK